MTETTAVAAVNPQVLFDKKFSAAEVEILRGVLEPDASISLIIPEQIDPKKLWDTFEVCCHVVTRLKEAGDKVKPLIGRMLVVLEDYPEILRAKGYETYEDFMKRGMPELFRICRSEAYAARRVAEKFPSLPIEEFKQIGIAKMQVLAQGTGEGEKDCDELLEYAKEHTVAEVKERIRVKKHMAEGEMDFCDIIIPGNVDIARQWKTFREAPEIQAYCETENPGRIFALMIAECLGHWLETGKYMMQGGR